MSLFVNTKKHISIVVRIDREEKVLTVGKSEVISITGNDEFRAGCIKDNITIITQFATVVCSF